MSQRAHLLAVAAAALIGGCAALSPALEPPATRAPMSATTRAVRDTLAPARAGIDSLPSRDAERVLATIPEPIAPSERVSPEERAASAPSPSRDSLVAAPRKAAADSSIAPDSTARADSSQREVPTPEPTQPLGDQPGHLERMLSPDSSAATAVPPAGAPSGAAWPAAGSGAAPARSGASRDSTRAARTASGPCYRLQVGAPANEVKAVRLRVAAESQLELPFVVVKARGLYKVRTRDCLDRGTVDHLRARAAASGFHGVFAVAEGRR